MSAKRLADGLLAAAAVFASVVLFDAPGTEDVALWRRWMANLAALGLKDGYEASGAIYPPGSAVALLLVVKLASALGLARFVVLKLSLLLSLVATSLVVWLWTRNVRLAVSVYLALALNGVALGYLDPYFAPTLLLSIWALERGRVAASGALLALSFVVKWQPVVLAPFFLLWLAAAKPEERPASTWRRLASFLAPVFALLAAAHIVFGPTFIGSLGHSLGHSYLSGNALNLNWVLGYALRAMHPERFGGLASGPAALTQEALIVETGDPWLILPQRLLFACFYAGSLLLMPRARPTLRDLVEHALLGYLAYFVFATGVHENHLFPAVLLAAVLAWQDPLRRAWFGVWAAAANLNLWVFYGLRGRPPDLGWLVELSLALSVLNGLSFLACFATVLRSRCSRPASVS